MKLWVSFNVFDGVELLEEAVARVRNVATHVSVVYQRVSNLGERDDTSADIAKNVSGVDVSIEYIPVKGGGHLNEVAKRNIGLSLVPMGEAFMTCDVDEYYDPDRLGAALAAFEASGKDGSACQMLTYYGDRTHVLDPPEDYYVPLFYRADGRSFKVGSPWPVLADPTRRLPGSVHVFPRHEIQMHHLSYVRTDIRKKLRNSSASPNFTARIENIARHYDAWKPGERALLAGREERWYNLVEVNNLL